jgi:hypothetical protein
VREIPDFLENHYMESEEQAHSVRIEVRAPAEPLPPHADAEPPGQTSTSAPLRRLTARRLYQRRRQRLQELIQQQANQPMSQ